MIWTVLAHLVAGALWTLVSFCAAYMAAALAALTDLSWGGIGRMFSVGILVFAGFEIAGFALMGFLPW